MTVKELIEKLKALPEDYEVIYESGNGFGSEYHAVDVDGIIVNDKTKKVEFY